MGTSSAPAARTVQLHFGRYVHPVYREQLHALPPGWQHASDHPALADTTAPTKLVIERGARFTAAKERAETLALHVLSEAGYVHVTRAPRATGAALIHSAERLLIREPLP